MNGGRRIEQDSEYCVYNVGKIIFLIFLGGMQVVIPSTRTRTPRLSMMWMRRGT